MTGAFKDEYGLKKVLAALGLSKGTWSYAQKKRSYEEKHSRMRPPLLEIARRHPEYEYRRRNAELRDRGIQINRKVVARLHTSWDLAVIKRVRKPKASSMAKLLKETGPRSTWWRIFLPSMILRSCIRILRRSSIGEAERKPS